MAHVTRKLCFVLPFCITSLAMAPTAIAATELGETGSSTVICDAPASYVQSVSTAPGYEVPASGGVITSWSAAAGVGGGQVRLAVMRPTAMPNQFMTVDASAPEQLKARSLNSFPARLPAVAGDVLGLLIVSGGHNCVLTNAGTPGDTGFREVGTIFEPGTTGNFSEPSQANRRLNLAAVLEADEDHDGVGDEPPSTTIIKKPADRVKSRKVRFGFGSSDPLATFMCKLDSAKFKSCSSPTKYSLEPGKHEFAVRATDPDGNRDPSPAVDRLLATTTSAGASGKHPDGTGRSRVTHVPRHLPVNPDWGTGS